MDNCTKCEYFLEQEMYGEKTGNVFCKHPLNRSNTEGNANPQDCPINAQATALTIKQAKQWLEDYRSEEADTVRRFRKGTKIYTVDWNEITAWERDEGPRPIPEFEGIVEWRRGEEIKLSWMPEPFNFINDLSFGYTFMTGERTRRKD